MRKGKRIVFARWNKKPLLTMERLLDRFCEEMEKMENQSYCLPNLNGCADITFCLADDCVTECRRNKNGNFYKRLPKCMLVSMSDLQNVCSDYCRKVKPNEGH